jgi:hypothetical protein
MEGGRAYPTAVALVMAALLCAVAFGGSGLGATVSSGDGAKDLKSTQARGGKPKPQGKQTPLLMRVLDPPQPVKGSDGKYHVVYELVLTNSSPGTATVG